MTINKQCYQIGHDCSPHSSWRVGTPNTSIHLALSPGRGSLSTGLVGALCLDGVFFGDLNDGSKPHLGPWLYFCRLCRLLSWISSLILDMLHVLYLFLKGSCRPHTARVSGLENMKWRSTQWPPNWEAETHVLFAAETSWSIAPTSRVSHHFKRHPWHQALILSFCHMKCVSSFSNIAIVWNIKTYQKHSTFTTQKDNKTQQFTSTSSNQTPDFGGPKPCSCRSRLCSCSSSCWCGWRFPRFLRDVVTPPTIYIWILKHETYVILVKHMQIHDICMHICHTSEVYACSTLFNKFKVSLRIPADLNCSDRSVYLRHHFCAEVHTLLAVAVGYPCGKLPWGRYTNTLRSHVEWKKHWWHVTVMECDGCGSHQKFPKKNPPWSSEWHAWQMLTAASMAGCSHGFLEQNSAPVWSTCQSFQIKSSTQTERPWKYTVYISIHAKTINANDFIWCNHVSPARRIRRIRHEIR